MKSEPRSEEKIGHVPREIPLELVDAIDFPRDPRKPKPDEEVFCDDSDEGGLVLPAFWRETEVKSAIAKNRERNPHANRSFRQSNSLVRERALQRTQRLMVAARRDPRLDRSLFAQPPQKVKSPPKKHNRSYPNIAPSKSIFDCDDKTENISSPESTFSSSSESLGSLPSVNEDQFTDHNSTKVDKNSGTNDLDSLSDSDDNDCSFTAFKKRKLSTNNRRAAKRTKHLESTSPDDDADDKVPPIMIDLKKKQVTPSTEKKNSEYII